MPLDALAHYDLPEPVECALSYSGLNNIYTIRAGNDHCVLKVYRAGWRTRSDVLREVDALLHLARHDVPVSLPIAGRDGGYVQTLSFPEGERQAVLFTYAKGQPVAVTPETCLLLGRTLATIHDATDDFESQRDPIDLERLLGRPMRALVPLLDERPEDRMFLEGLTRRLKEYISHRPEDALDRGFCHGDFRAANVHLDQETQGMTVFDFDCSGAGFRAYDLAYFRTTIDATCLDHL